MATRPFKELVADLPPERRAKIERRKRAIRAEMPLYELREARELTQQQIAGLLNVNQAAISKMEKRTDMYLHTLRNFIHAMGGELDVIARFPDGDVRINQFKDIEERRP